MGQQQLAPFVHSRQALAVLALPGQDVDFVRGAISGNQIVTHRPSYINAILIQSRGQALPRACNQCLGRPGLRPFPVCLRVPGHFQGCCGNCKLREHGARCSFGAAGDDGGDGGDSGGRRTSSPSSDEDEEEQQQPPPPRRLGGPPAGGEEVVGCRHCRQSHCPCLKVRTKIFGCFACVRAC